MRLKGIRLANFRSYREEELIAIDDLTAIVGRNDTGKSTILEALEIFFNNTSVKIESEDASIDGDVANVSISCIFDNLPGSLTIDSRAKTSLEEEHMLNPEGDLEIVKYYNCGLKTPSVSVFVRSNYPSALNYNDLH